jgi:Cdc6-like AAA superfamily ATPase
MLFPRNIKHLFMDWKTRENRKPLVVRGARQTGKTSAVHELASEAFDSYVYINLEKADDLSLFSRMHSSRNCFRLYNSNSIKR